MIQVKSLKEHTLWLVFMFKEKYEQYVHDTYGLSVNGSVQYGKTAKRTFIAINVKVWTEFNASDLFLVKLYC